MSITVYNVNTEQHSGSGVFYCGRGSILGNPYTHIKDRKTKALFIVPSRDIAIERYSDYFDTMYGSNKEFTEMIDEIYDRYCRGEEVFLGCYCKPQSCHCDIIVDKLRKRLVKEKIGQISKKH